MAINSPIWKKTRAPWKPAAAPAALLAAE